MSSWNIERALTKLWMAVVRGSISISVFYFKSFQKKNSFQSQGKLNKQRSNGPACCPSDWRKNDKWNWHLYGFFPHSNCRILLVILLGLVVVLKWRFLIKSQTHKRFYKLRRLAILEVQSEGKIYKGTLGRFQCLLACLRVHTHTHKLTHTYTDIQTHTQTLSHTQTPTHT